MREKDNKQTAAYILPKSPSLLNIVISCVIQMALYNCCALVTT